MVDDGLQWFLRCVAKGTSYRVPFFLGPLGHIPSLDGSL